MAGFTFDYSRLNIQGVQSVVISDIQPDADSVQYIRLIQLYTDPASVTNRRPVLEISVHGGDQTVNDKGALQITIPGGLDF